MKQRPGDELVAAAVEATGNKSAVAQKFGIDRKTIYRILERVKTDSPMISSFRQLRADINSHNQIQRQEKQVKILESITDKEIEDADLKTKMIMLNTLGLDKNREYLAERLENDQSTENVAVIVQAIKEAKKRLEGEDGS